VDGTIHITNRETRGKLIAGEISIRNEGVKKVVVAHTCHPSYAIYQSER
jgi:aminopeptidase-like protein